MRFLIVFIILNIGFMQGQNYSEKAISLSGPNDLDDLIAASKDKKLVLLGEASHGTHEYYKWRSIISRRLIAEENFRFIAVEGDFASLYELNRYIKHEPGAGNSAREILSKLDRWPRWMWANEEVVELAEWLRKYNQNLSKDNQIGFYGMDVYDEWHSKEVILKLLKKIDRELYRKVQREYDCFNPHKGESWEYARAVKSGKKPCDEATENVVNLIREYHQELENLPDDEYFYLLQNAIVVHNAEEFYRTSLDKNDALSWNSRVFHMHQTIRDLVKMYGDNAKGIVWAHNTHIGDAAYTNMRNFGEKNIGQLTREYFGADQVFLIGLTSYEGEVVAGSNWGAPMKVMTIPKAVPGSIEAQLNRINKDSFYIIFDENDRLEKKLTVTGNRAVGVVYNPKRDRQQFVPTVVPLRYDALLFFKYSTALHVLD